jgi:hypothetical protein
MNEFLCCLLMIYVCTLPIAWMITVRLDDAVLWPLIVFLLLVKRVKEILDA